MSNTEKQPTNKKNIKFMENIFAKIRFFSKLLKLKNPFFSKEKRKTNKNYSIIKNKVNLQKKRKDERF